MATRPSHRISLKTKAGFIIAVLIVIHGVGQSAIAQGPPPVTAPPALTAVTPNFGSAAQPVQVTLTGRNFLPGQTSINVSATGLTVSGVTVLSSTTLKATFTVGSDATAGVRGISVTTSLGTTLIRSFTIMSVTPALTSVTPTSASPGSATTVTLNGTNFVNGATTVAISDLAVTPTVQFISSTSVKATFTVPPNALGGLRNITATTTIQGVSRTTNARPFTINNIAPVLTTFSPSSGTPGASIILVLTGKNFVSGATTVTIGNLAVTPTVTFISDTSIKAEFTIPANATAGFQNVQVKTTVSAIERASSTRPFTISNIAPVLSSLSPTSGNAAFPVVMTLAGKYFVSGSTSVAISDLAVVPTVEVISPTSLKATFTIPLNTTPGPRTITVTTSPGGNSRSSNSRSFSITSALPVLSAVAPSSGNAGQDANLTLTGRNFVVGDTSITISGEPEIVIPAGSVTVNTAGTVLTAPVTLGVMEAPGTRNITVSTDHGTSAPRPFRVIAGNLVPALTSISPAEGIAGDQVTVTFSGTNFVWQQTAINILGIAATATVTTVPNPTSLTAVLTILDNAPAAAGTLSVTTPHGTSGTKPFAVKTTPKLTSITPDSGGNGAEVDVTLTGKNFTGANAINITGTAVQIGAFTIVNATTMTAVFTVDGNATEASYNVTVTKTGQGTSNALPFATTVDWSEIESMITTRLWGHTATLLNNEVLVAGGNTDETLITDQSEVYEIDDIWEAPETMQAERTMHSATRLSGDRVLVAGGAATASAELYTPATGWAFTDSMDAIRRNHAAIVIDGQVLVIGGVNGSNQALNSAETWDPIGDTWTPLAVNMNVARARATATAISGNRILVVGGHDSLGDPIASTEIYNGSTWVLTDEPMAVARSGHIAVALPDGRVLVAGGFNADGLPMSSVEIYDPVDDEWDSASAMRVARHGHAAALTADGKVLVSGGFSDEFTTRLKSVEIYNPATNKWSYVGSMSVARAYHTITPFDDESHDTDDKRIMVTGGAAGDDGKTAEVYDSPED